MRHWLLRYGPIAVVALALQVLAPFVVLAPLAATPFDPLVHAALCSDLARADGNSAPAHRGDAEGGCCVLCAPLAGGPAVLGVPAIAALSPWRRFQRIAWRSGAEPLLARRLDLNASARAPPAAA